MTVYPGKTVQADNRAIVGHSWSEERPPQLQMNWRNFVLTGVISLVVTALALRTTVGRNLILGA